MNKHSQTRNGLQERLPSPKGPGTAAPVRTHGSGLQNRCFHRRVFKAIASGRDQGREGVSRLTERWLSFCHQTLSAAGGKG